MLIFWAVLGGFLLDALFGDPAWLPHPVVLMGRCISALEKQLGTELPKRRGASWPAGPRWPRCCRWARWPLPGLPAGPRQGSIRHWG